MPHADGDRAGRHGPRRPKLDATRRPETSSRAGGRAPANTGALSASELTSRSARGIAEALIGRRPAGFRDGWLVDVAPLAVVTAILWLKLVQISVLLPRESWAGYESLPFVSIISAYPDVFSATLGSLLLLFGLLPLVPRVRRAVVLVAGDLILTTLAVGDLVHVHFYADVTSSAELSSAFMLTSVVHDIVTLLNPAHGLYYLDVVVGLAALPYYVRACKRMPGLGREPRTRLCIGLLASGLLLVLPTTRLASARDGIFAYSALRLEAASAIGLLPYHLADALTGLGSGRRSIDEPERERVRRFLDREREARGSPSELFGIAAGTNVIIISGESLQAFPIGLEIAGQPVAPRLSAFARESMSFVNYYEPTHLGSTSDAEFAVMQSLYPLGVGVAAARYARNQYRGLPAVLAERGYTTFAAVAALGHFWNMHELHPRYGFQRSYFEAEYQVTERIGPWLSDREYFRQTLSILQAQREPFMGLLFSNTNHYPYELPDKYKTLQLGELEGTKLGDYLHTVHYFDEAFGELVDRLRESGLLDRSVLVLYGDHQGFVGRSPELPRILGFDEWNEYHQFRVVKKVPLFIRLPHGQAAGVKTVTGSHLDVAPTLLALLGATDDTAVFLGRDLTTGRDSPVVFRDGSFADGRHYFANRFASPFASRCYEARSGRPIDCEPLEAVRRAARERLEISDLIVEGDLIPALGAAR